MKVSDIIFFCIESQLYYDKLYTTPVREQHGCHMENLQSPTFLLYWLQATRCFSTARQNMSDIVCKQEKKQNRNKKRKKKKKYKLYWHLQVSFFNSSSVNIRTGVDPLSNKMIFLITKMSKKVSNLHLIWSCWSRSSSCGSDSGSTRVRPCINVSAVRRREVLLQPVFFVLPWRSTWNQHVSRSKLKYSSSSQLD